MQAERCPDREGGANPSHGEQNNNYFKRGLRNV